MSDFAHQLETIKRLYLDNQTAKASALFRTLPFQDITSETDLQAFGWLALQLHHTKAAQQIFMRALTLHPHNILFANNLATALMQLGDLHQATTVLQRVVDAKPDYATAWINLGSCHEQSAKLERAKDCFHTTLRIEPDNALAHIRLAVVAERQSDVKALSTHADEALRLLPGHPDTQYVQAFKHIHSQSYDLALRAINLAIQIAGSNPVYLYLRGSILEKLNRFEDALKEFTDVNATTRPNSAVRTHFIDEHRHALKNLQCKPQEHTAPLANNGPLYIISSPRSGSSLLAKMLAQHPSFENYGELDFLERLHQLATSSLNIENNLAKLITELDSNPRATEIIHMLRSKESELWAGLHTQPNTYWMDKGIMNAYHLPLIAKLHHNTPIIHIIRDGREVSLSIFRTHFRETFWFKHDCRDAILHWQNNIQMVRTCAQRYGLNMIELRYEDLVANPEREIRDILNWLNLTWHGDILRFHEDRRQTNTASYAQVNTPLYSSSLHFARHHYPSLYNELTQLATETLRTCNYSV